MISRKFFRIRPDYSTGNFWYLKSPLNSLGIEIDPRQFTEGVSLFCETPLVLPIRRTGVPINFNFCDFDMIVISKQIAEKLEEFVGTSIQRIPVLIPEVTDSFEILNVCVQSPCIDEVNSDFTKWADEDGRPDKVGKFRMILKLKIDPFVVSDLHIFRVSEWPIALIISEEVKEILEAQNVLGVKFELVT